MIYTDPSAVRDTDTLPADRYGEHCLHCGSLWHPHNGWACDVKQPAFRFSELRQEQRYLTESMRAGTAPPPKVPAPSGSAPSGVRLGPRGRLRILIAPACP